MKCSLGEGRKEKEKKKRKGNKIANDGRLATFRMCDVNRVLGSNLSLLIVSFNYSWVRFVTFNSKCQLSNLSPLIVSANYDDDYSESDYDGG